MALAVRYAIRSVSFKGKNITDLVRVRRRKSGDITTLYTDPTTGHINGHHLDGIRGEIDVEVLDPSIFKREAADIAIGAVGTLILTYGKRVDGVGFAATANDIIWTATNAMITSEGDDVPVRGESSGTISFSVADNGSGVLGVWSSGT